MKKNVFLTLISLVLVASVLVLLAAPLEGFVAPLDLPGYWDAAIACSWALLLAILAFISLRAWNNDGDDFTSADR
jgi:hypothetical protein